jgi:hypothetical protein
MGGRAALEKMVSRETSPMFHGRGAGKRDSAKQPHALKNRAVISMT